LKSASVKERLLQLFYEPRLLLFLYAFAALFIAVQLVSEGSHPCVPTVTSSQDIMNRPEYVSLFRGRQLTEYNNYRIFTASFYHLIHGQNLYGIYPAEHWDLFKYSPTFALFMGFMAWLPDMVGLFLWNLLNMMVMYVAIRRLPFSNKAQCLMLWYLGNELITALANTQSNGLMAGLMILGFACLHRGRVASAALWLALAVYIKPYAAIGFCVFLFYPGKARVAGYILLYAALLALLPLVVTPWHTLCWQYQNWVALIRADAAASTGLSVSGWLHTWFGLGDVRAIVTAVGGLLFILPFARLNIYRNDTFRLLTLASLLVWVVIFNHKAESPTYAIALSGIAIWYAAMPHTFWRTALFLFIFVFTSLSTTDLFPAYLRTHFIDPYVIKAVPCIIGWVVILIELLSLSPQQQLAQEN
jgi:Glycosyltransferase family 87